MKAALLGVFTVSLFGLGVALQPMAEAPPALDLDPLIRATMRRWHVPGCAVAIVHNDQVVYLKGFGVLETGGAEPVTPDTLFPIASCTKAFTSAGLALLADEGKLSFDDPVRKHVPFFKLSEASANELVTIRDLTCHRTGVGNHDFLWYHAPWGPEEAVRRVGFVPLEQPFRQGFAYQSTMFTAAGLAIESASGQHWDAFMRRRLIEPLGMKGVAFTTSAARQNPDHARPHRLDDQDVPRAIPFYVMDRPEPAGSIHASARALAHWLRFQLGQGRFAGNALVSARNLGETQTPQMLIPMSPANRAENPHTVQLAYGMGWVVQDYRGQRVVQHAGMIDGFRAHITLVPEAGLGIVILDNLDQTRMNLALSNLLVDRLLGLPATDWNRVLGDEVRKRQAAARAQRDAVAARIKQRRPPTLPAAAYLGEYDNPAYGRSRIAFENGMLVWHWGKFTCPLQPLDGDAFLTVNEILDGAEVTFSPILGRMESFKVGAPLQAEFRRP